MSGYITFSTEIRQRVKDENPNASFGEISKIIGAQWRNLPEAKKKVYNDKAAANAKTKAPKPAKKAK